MSPINTVASLSADESPKFAFASSAETVQNEYITFDGNAINIIGVLF